MIRFEPLYQAAPWGGRRFEEEFGRELPEGLIGESWELVELPERESVVSSGRRSGQKLGDLWRSGALGGSAKGPFPFLLKWIDAAQSLSFQVHPDEDACAKLGKGSPKTEAWYVAHTDPKSVLMIGHYPGLDPSTLRQAAAGGTLQKWLYETRPRVGDIFLVKAGTIHAIGPSMLLEVQQPSDTTYRIYDWGRVGADGMPRQLHLEEASASVRYERYGAPQPSRVGVVGPCFAMRAIRMGVEIPATGLRVLAADSGPAKLVTEFGQEILDYGEVVIMEPSDGPVKVATGSAVLITEADSPLARAVF